VLVAPLDKILYDSTASTVGSTAIAQSDAERVGETRPLAIDMPRRHTRADMQ
jgi:hypothetical protein